MEPTAPVHTSSTKEVKPAPIKTSAIPQSNGKRLFELHFRVGNRKPQVKIFQLDGDLPVAITRGREHCDKMGYRFCGVYPFLVDLDIQEASRDDELRDSSYI